ncbi:MAG: hypothetical protein NDI61_00345 [Bdellovibrionaceae bacterium]|nr:hypothetical protein [Pseudobdellovibrionaceae bacterium]
MNTHKWSRYSVLSMLGFLLLFQYQNCAPTPAGSSAIGDVKVALQQQGSPVDVIDQINEGKLAFATNQPIAIAAGESGGMITLPGTCDPDQSGATLRWTVRDEAAAELGEGFVSCQDGAFTVTLSKDDFDCGSFHLVAQLGVAESPAVTITRQCAP